MDTLERADEVLARLRERYGDRHAFPRHGSSYQLLVAAILCAQDRNETVIGVTEHVPTTRAQLVARKEGARAQRRDPPLVAENG